MNDTTGKLVALCRRHRDELPRWAFCLEDCGLQGASDPELVLIVDPIDGTRPAAYVDIGPAIIATHPWTEAEFRRVGRGAVSCNSPYNIAGLRRPQELT